MEGNYVLRFGGQAVGRVQVTREGLYYRFCCRCRLSGDVVCKAVVHWETGRESLGILTPEGDGFSLRTKIPAKRFGTEKPEFSVVPSRPVAAGRFVPIYPEEPFSYIERLKESYLAMRNGQVGAMLPESS